MGELLAVYVFGSAARGEPDDRSDLDLLAIVRDGAGKVPSSEVESLVPPALRSLDASISWYGAKRIEQMFKAGELFAWHLYRETEPLLEKEPVIANLGMPAPYEDMIDDIVSFQRVLQGIPSQLEDAPANAVYELGLIYICLRNIAMAASWALARKPDFTRYSPFNLNGLSPLPVTRDEYDLAMASRLAGQRGAIPTPIIDPRLVSEIHAKVTPWIEGLRLTLSSESRE